MFTKFMKNILQILNKFSSELKAPTKYFIFSTKYRKTFLTVAIDK